MSIQKMNLRNLLRIFFAPEKLRNRLLRDDALDQVRKERGERRGGGSFYTPFWADAKDHASGFKDLIDETRQRIAEDRRKAKTYPILRDGFLQWWNDKRRWRNEPFEIIPQTIPVEAAMEEIGCIVKIENMFSVKIGDHDKRLIYPYFSESPIISTDAARIGISIIDSAMRQFKSEDIRILDIRRGVSFGTVDAPLQGDERAIFIAHYKRALDDWEKIKKELD